ncbi:hypothetical protein SERLA73DRAFT_158340, partial [Serpula lacrymans var. lacrymans S7.3]
MADAADQDRRFSDKELKLLKSMKFPAEFDKKVDMRKVNVQVIRPWIAKKVVELVGLEDEVVVEYAMGLLEDPDQPTPDPKKMQINLTGFLTNSTSSFMIALWNLLLEAQESPAGVPRTFVEEKKEEMRKAKEGDTRALNERDRRARLDDVRQNDRASRPSRASRSPPPRSPPPRRRRRSPTRSPSRSRSPPPRRRVRSPSYSPPPREARRYGGRDSRSPPPRRRRLSPRSPSRSVSRSRSPPPRSYGRRRSPSPPRGNRRMSISRSRSRSPVSPPPRRRDSKERPRDSGRRKFSRTPS